MSNIHTNTFALNTHFSQRRRPFLRTSCHPSENYARDYLLLFQATVQKQKTKTKTNVIVPCTSNASEEFYSIFDYNEAIYSFAAIHFLFLI